MPTTVTSSIGTTGRNYSFLQIWEDACPAHLDTDDKIWRGECYNDSEFTDELVISGMTVDSSCYVELTAAAGQSFQDHANVRTNPLRYDQSKGVGVRMTSAWAHPLTVSVNYCRVSRIQWGAFGSNSTGAILGGEWSILKDCFVLSNNGVNAGALYNCIGINCVFVQIGSGNGPAIQAAGRAIGCTIIKPSDVTPGGTGLVASYTNNIAQSCAAFGFTTAASATGWDTTNSKNNATDLASGLPGSNNQHSVTYSQYTPFTDADKDSLDLRAIAGTALIDAGYRDSTNAPNDISGTARDATPTIGAWEIAAAAGGAGLQMARETPAGMSRGMNRGLLRILQ